MRTIKHIIPSVRINMNGNIIEQPLPFKNIEQINPFLLVHHWKEKLKGNQIQKNVGVGPHPHRGFSPVTFVFKGGVLHQDSRGNKSEVLAGGTQWMNAGMGIIHSERPSKDLVENGGELEFIQFWINSPSKAKMKQPSYQPLSKEETPTIMLEDKKSFIQIVSGEFKNKKGIIKSDSPVLALRFEFEKHIDYTIEVPENYNALIYVLDGILETNNQEIKEKELVWFNNNSSEIKLKTNSKTRFILLSGEPILEPIATYGPFVMNSQTEIMEALRDYQKGKMGFLVEEFD